MPRSPSSADPFPPARLERASTLGRYVILDLVGRGSMGEVYAAYDPELDRKVALKLLRGGSVEGSAARVRILREAQAAAKLSHPNVVVVYDVATLGDQVFIAMEFVEGHTLSYWLLAATRTWPDVLKVFLDAGRGLAAAHDKGLVHRDFKPDNVMVGADGQVRVADFGLARVTKNDPSDATVLEDVPDQRRELHGNIDATRVIMAGSMAVTGGATPLTIDLTQTGDMLGTPAYMSPEQHRGRQADTRSDQFSFCVALYEALYGERPFAATSLFELAENVLAGKVREAPSQSNVPENIRRILLRGLRTAPKERWPTLKALLAELENDRLVAGRDRFVIGAAAKLADVWEAPTLDRSTLTAAKAAIREAFLATGKDYAAKVFETVRRTLDGYAATWSTTYIEACEATHLRSEQSTEILDLKMAYLDERLEELRALCRILRGGSAEVVAHAVTAASALGSLDRCRDVRLLRAVVRPPDDPRTQEAVERLRVQLAEARVLGHVGKFGESLRLLDPLEKPIRELGYGPLLAELLLEKGRYHGERLEPAAAATALEEAVWTAEASRHDDVAAEAATYLIYMAGDTQSRFEVNEIWARHADAVLRRMGRGDHHLWGWLFNNRSALRKRQGRFAEALADARQAVAIKEKLGGPDTPDVAVSLGNVALYLALLDQVEEAVVHFRRALAIAEAGLGPRHPQCAYLLSNYGELLNRLGQFQAAREVARRAIEIFESEGDSDGLILSYPLVVLGSSLLEDGQLAEAVAVLERAVSLREASPIEPALRGEAHFALARALGAAGACDRARALAVLAADECAQGPSPVQTKKKVARIHAWLAALDPPGSIPKPGV